MIGFGWVIDFENVTIIGSQYSNVMIWPFEVVGVTSCLKLNVIWNQHIAHPYAILLTVVEIRENCAIGGNKDLQSEFQ